MAAAGKAADGSKNRYLTGLFAVSDEVEKHFVEAFQLIIDTKPVAHIRQPSGDFKTPKTGYN